jgi:adenylate cyclase
LSLREELFRDIIIEGGICPAFHTMSPNRQRMEVYEFGPFRLDLVVRQLFRQDIPVPLPPQTFDILKILVENRGLLVTREELIQQIWQDQVVEENNLTVRMSTLRKALGQGAGNRFIETVPSYGYRFVARVRQLLSEHAEPQEEEAFDSLAVLPLINENNLHRLNYLCEGITESLITSLSHIANLRVMAYGTVSRYKGRELAPREVGKELGVRAVLMGKVNQVSDSLVLNFEMIDVKDGAYVWGAKFRRQVNGLIAFEEELAREVSENLRIRLSRAEESKISKRNTDNSQAHHLYMKGRYFWNKRNVFGVKKAVEYFRSAVRHAPRYALAYAGLADAYFLLSNYGLRRSKETMRKAKAAALRALELAPQLAEAHVSVAIIKSNFELDWAGAESEFKLAIELNPYHSQAHHYYASLLTKLGRLDEALVEISKAQEIDPLSVSINLFMGKIHYFARRYDKALKKGREILEIEPRFAPALGIMGLAYLEMGRYREAVREFNAMVRMSTEQYIPPPGEGNEGGQKSTLPDPDPEALSFLGYAYAVAGKRNKALQILDRLRELRGRRYVQPENFAMVYIGLRDHDKVFEWLERTFAERSSTRAFIKVYPFFDSLRSDPRYDELVRRVGLHQ